MPEEMSVRIFQLTAVATDDNESYQAGNRHVLIAYVSGDVAEETPSSLVEALADHGWGDYYIKRVGLLPPESLDDEIVRSAQENGVALVAYDDPIE
jgi:hypothetical protein